MTNDDALIRFQISSEFILARVLPTSAELSYGFHHGWLSREDVIAVALGKYEAGVPVLKSEEALALLLSDEVDRVDDLVDDMEPVDDTPVERRARLWLFLALSWLLENRDSFEEPLEVIELLYTDFDYPEEIRGLVRYMPPLAGEPVGLDAIEERWRSYVQRVGSEYRQRLPPEPSA